MTRFRLTALLLSIAGLAVPVCGASFAADLPSAPAPVAVAPGIAPLPPVDTLTDLRLGVFAHDPFSPEKGSADINGEILFPKWFGVSSEWSFLYPRLHVGATVNTAGKTSSAYAGLTWDYQFQSGFFLETSFGGAVHNGYTGDIPKEGWNSLGCSPMFRESASIGYRFTRQLSLMATIEHLSNAGLCDQNRGLTNAGVRLGYSF